MFFFCVGSLFCCAEIASFLILQSSRWEREGWLLYFGCHLNGILCLFLMLPWFGLQFVNVAFPGHTHFLLLRVQYDKLLQKKKNSPQTNNKECNIK